VVRSNMVWFWLLAGTSSGPWAGYLEQNQPYTQTNTTQSCILEVSTMSVFLGYQRSSSAQFF
jgi:hypothetical protein